MHNRKKGILVTSVDPKDATTSVVVSSNEGSALNGSNLGNEDIRSRMPTSLEAKGLLFCRLVNGILRNQNAPCFVGYEVIYNMVSSGLAKNRAEALALGKDLSKKLRLFYRVEFKRNTFSDDGKVYKFRPEVLLSVITKSSYSIQKVTPSDHDRKSGRIESEPTPTTKFRKIAPKILLSESKKEEKKVSRKLKMKGRNSNDNESVDMIPQDQSPMSEEDREKPDNYGQRATMKSIRERGACSLDDDRSIYTEITVSDHNNGSAFPPVPSLPQHDDDEDSYMDFTVSTSGCNSNHDEQSYFDEFTLEDEDEYDIMSLPATPVVRRKIKVRPSTNDLFSPNDVTSFNDCVAPESQKSDSSMSRRMRQGELDIEIPYLDEEVFLEDV